MSDLVYIASPYSHESSDVMRHRFEAVCDYAGEEMADGRIVYSPIAHSHPIAVRKGLPTDWGYWQKFDHVMLSRCTSLEVLMLDGWRESMAIALGIPVNYVSWEAGE